MSSKTIIQRTCCDICGAPFIVHGERWELEPTDGFCYECQMTLSDEKLENPDKWDIPGEKRTSLNYERFAWLWNLRMLPKKGFPRSMKAYNMWREAHPELGKLFNMSDFQEVPGIEQKIEALWDEYEEEPDKEIAKETTE